MCSSDLGDKTTGLTFAHPRFDFDGIAATRFEVGASDAQTLSIAAAGFSLVDINHAAIRERPEAPENEQTVRSRLPGSAIGRCPAHRGVDTGVLGLV